MSNLDLLDTQAALTLVEAADVLRLYHTRGARKGEPNRHLVVELVHAGKLGLVDPDQDRAHWTISTAEVRKYLGLAA